MICYMIRHKQTGKWSKGGVGNTNKIAGEYGHWADKKKQGKIWKSKGALKNHLNYFSEHTREKWEIIEVNIDLED